MTVFKNMDKSKKIVLICAAAFVILSFVACVVFVNGSGSKQIGSNQKTKQAEKASEIQKASADQNVTNYGEPSAAQDREKEKSVTEEKMPLHVITSGSIQASNTGTSAAVPETSRSSSRTYEQTPTQRQADSSAPHEEASEQTPTWRQADPPASKEKTSGQIPIWWWGDSSASREKTSGQTPEGQQPQSDYESPADPNGMETALDVF